MNIEELDKETLLYDFKALAEAFLHLCEGSSNLEEGLFIIASYFPLAEDGYYLIEEY